MHRAIALAVIATLTIPTSCPAQTLDIAAREYFTEATEALRAQKDMREGQMAMMNFQMERARNAMAIMNMELSKTKDELARSKMELELAKGELKGTKDLLKRTKEILGGTKEDLESAHNIIGVITTLHNDWVEEAKMSGTTKSLEAFLRRLSKSKGLPGRFTVGYTKEQGKQ